MGNLESLINKHYEIVINACKEDNRIYKYSKEEHKEWFTRIGNNENYNKMFKTTNIERMKHFIWKCENRHTLQWFCMD